jgi:hypothetical protein
VAELSGEGVELMRSGVIIGGSGRKNRKYGRITNRSGTNKEKRSTAVELMAPRYCTPPGNVRERSRMMLFGASFGFFFSAIVQIFQSEAAFCLPVCHPLILSPKI